MKKNKTDKPDAELTTAQARRERASASLDVQPLTPEGARALLNERAKALARTPASDASAADVIEIVTFELRSERYGIESSYVREIVRPGDISRVPETPDFLVGVTNLRGEILAVMDLQRFFGLPATEISQTARIVVLGGESPEFGMLANAVREATTLRADEIHSAPGSVAGVGREFIRGVTDDALILIDGAALLEHSGLFVDQSEEAGS